MSRLSLKRSPLTPSCSFVSFVVTAVFLFGCARVPKQTTWQSATGAGEYERLMWKAVEKRDWKVFEYHLAPMFVGVTARGKTLDRDAWVDYWKQAQPQEALLSEIRTHSEGADMVVTFVLHLSGSTPTAATAQQTYRVVSVWQQVKHGWTLTTTSITPITAE
jgi:ketosteroid isomerase-like protein